MIKDSEDTHVEKRAICNKSKMVSVAAANGTVIPAFNVPHLPMMSAIITALKEHDTLAIIQVARLEFTKFQAKSLEVIADEYRKYAEPRLTSLHLDHTPVIDEDGLAVDWITMISEAISLGYDSVMIDGSRLPFAENVAITKRVVDMAHCSGVLVEAELGAVLGHESGPLPPYDELFASKKGFTDPDEARMFVDGTKVDWLSVSIGSIHGAISESTKNQAKVAARLDIEQLKMLKESTNIPLVLHGGSGVQQACIDEAVANGIAKINIATDIRQPYEQVLAAGGSIADAQDKVRKAVSRIIKTLGIEGTASLLGEKR